MKIKVFCIILGLLLFLPFVTAKQVEISSNEKIIENIDVDNQNDNVQPMPHWGLSFVFYIGNASVYEYYEDDSITITIRPFVNSIRWFCIGRPFGWASAGGPFAVSFEDFRGYVGPKPIVEDGSINFIFGLVEDIVVCLS
ncbi:hypothetical protein AYK20_01090 [Thermoplasmatales archaeon SG8-52-1]|nr:MAG: hypothetical protein AYK20_01090 [Thermoplasmatales archaeon SG8-52-1]